MSLLNKIKLSYYKKKYKVEINYLMKYIEGCENTLNTYTKMSQSEGFKSLIKKLIIFLPAFFLYQREVDDYFTRNLKDNIVERVRFFWMCKRILSILSIEVIPFNEEEDTVLLYYDIQPKWLFLNDLEYLNDVIKNHQVVGDRRKTIKNCKKRIREDFKYDKRPPVWLQNPEWPIINGKPMRFRYQDKNPDRPYEGYLPDEINYYFYDPENGENITIIQRT